MDDRDAKRAAAQDWLPPIEQVGKFGGYGGRSTPAFASEHSAGRRFEYGLA